MCKKAINVRTITADEISDAKQLWLDCFNEDSAEFVDYYFEHRTGPEHIIGAFQSGRLCSMLHALPMRLRFGDSVESIGFITGVCTHPIYRNRGIARKVMEYALNNMRQSGLRLAVLNPSSEEFYRRFGFETFLERSIFRITKHDLEHVSIMHQRHNCINLTPQNMSKCYARFIAAFDGAAVRSELDCKRLLLEYNLNGAIKLSLDNAYALGYVNGNSCRLNEFVACGKQAGIAAVSKLLQSYSEVYLPAPASWQIGQVVEVETNMLNVLHPSAFSDIPLLKHIAVGERAIISTAFSFDKY